MTLTERILNGTRLFDFFLETSPKRFWHECMVAFCNILLFVPMGIYASFFCKAARAIAIGCVFSCVLEGIQLFANFGVFSFEDILLNTVGAVIGAFFYQVLVRRIPEGFVKKANWCIIVIGTPITVFAYITVINAIILYFS